MADIGKEFPATPHRKREARQKGQVAKSIEVNTAIVLFVGFMAFRLFLPPIVEEIQKTTSYCFTHLTPADFTIQSVWRYSLEFILRISMMILPLLAVICLASITSGLFQVGFLHTWKPLKPQLSRLNPVNGVKRLFSYRVLVELLKSFIKMLITGGVAYTVIKGDIDKLMLSIDMTPQQSSMIVGDIAFSVVIKISLSLIGLGIVDYIYQKYEYNKSLRMSRQEVKDEMVRYEGRPEVKQRIRVIQRQMAMRRMMQDVPKADVVIRNPTHYAIALRYNPKESAAPVVVAKGARLIAEKIIKIAKENNVPVVENRPLARMLYKMVDVGQGIPLALYQAIADILAYVWKSGKARKGWF